MSETDAILEVAKAIRLLASAIGALSTPLWMMLFFKDMSSNNSSAIRDIAKSVDKLRN